MRTRWAWRKNVMDLNKGIPRRTDAPLGTYLYLLLACVMSAPALATDPIDPNHYQLHFRIDLTDTDGYATAQVSVTQSTALLRKVRFNAPADRYKEFSADGSIKRDGNRL